MSDDWTPRGVSRALAELARHFDRERFYALVNCKFDPAWTNELGQTLLHRYAYSNNCSHLVFWELVQRGVDPSVVDQAERTAACCAHEAQKPANVHALQFLVHAVDQRRG